MEPLEQRRVLSTIYTDLDATGANDGSSWANAYVDLQAALASANSGDEVWVAEGTYMPTSGTDRTVSFNLKSGVELYGGFAGTETAREHRDWTTNVTTLSGDIGTPGDKSDNSFHVLYASSVTDATLDGVTVTGGNAASLQHRYGGGLHNSESSPTLTNVIFTNNSADFDDNLHYHGGGGMYNYHSSPTLTNVIFSGNSANGYLGSGGGIYNYHFSSPGLANVIFVGNSADYGGGIHNSYYSAPTISNVTSTGNTARIGGGMYNFVVYDDEPVVTNSIFWGNTASWSPQQIYNDSTGGNVTVTYSIVQGGWGGTGNLDADPLFVDAANGDVRLQTGSPAIDAGTSSGAPLFDLDGNPRPVDGDVDGTAEYDMGAYESEPALGPATLTVGDAQVFEGNSGTTQLVFPVALDSPLSVNVSVDYQTEDGTAEYESGDGDYQATTGTLTISAGDVAGEIVVMVNGDEEVETDETLQLVVDNRRAGAAGVALAGTTTVGGSFVEVDKFVPSVGDVGDWFGFPISIDGTTAVIGARNDDDKGTSAGAAYVFEDTGAGWQQVAKLTAFDGAANHLFGHSVAISGDTVIVGAENANAAYVFERDQGGSDNWGEVVKLTASGASRLGSAVALEGTTAIVGAVGVASNSGAAYIFQDNGSGWTEVQKLTGSDTAYGGHFGLQNSVGISDNRVVVGAIHNDGSTGGAYIFEDTGNGWSEVQKLAPGDLSTGDNFGMSAIDGDLVMVGAHKQNAGAAYVYELQPTLVIAVGTIENDDQIPNHPPTVGATYIQVTVDEGSLAENSGTFDDVDLSDNVTITASLGTITDQDSGNSGDWTWEYDSGDDLADTVIITADDGNGGVATTSFDLTVSNVAPIVQLGASPATLDVTFGTGGQVTTEIPGPTMDIATDVVVQADSKTVVLGFSQNFTGAPTVLVRYNVDGSLDSAFGTDGIVLLPTGIFGTSLAIQSDGKLLVAAQMSNGNDDDFAVLRFNSEGTADLSFGTGGLATADFGGNSDYSPSIAVQSDGGIVLVGMTYSTTVEKEFFGLARFDSSGLLDPEFGAGGTTTADLGYSSQYLTGIDLQPDGRIVVSGNVWSTTADFAVARFNTNGTLDTSFGEAGAVVTDLGSSEDIANALTVQPDGRIVVAGSRSAVSQEFAAVRYESDGTLDVSFGAGGVVTTNFADAASAQEAFYQSDGKIILIGGSNDPAEGFAVVRYNPDGSPDTAFGTGGKVTTAIGRLGISSAMAAALNPAEQLVVTGISLVRLPVDFDFTTVRYLNDGGVDTSFGGDGIVTTGLTGGTASYLETGIAVQPDGKTIVAGDLIEALASLVIGVARYNVDGSLDSTFGSDGTLTVGFPGEITNYTRFAEVLVQPDGKILLVGDTQQDATGSDIAVARLNIDGTFDAGFGTGGQAVIDFGDINEMVFSAALQSDGRIVVGGTNSSEQFVVRLNSDGSVDTTFGGTGKVSAVIGAPVQDTRGIVVQPDGKIVTASTISGVSGSEYGVVRYEANGTLDVTFGTGGIVSIDVPTLSGELARELLLQTDGKLLIAGSAISPGDFLVSRLHEDGTVDASFGNAGTATIDVGSSEELFGAALQPDGSVVVVGRSDYGPNFADFVVARVNETGQLDSSFGSGGVTTIDFGGTDDTAHGVAIHPSGGIIISGTTNDVLAGFNPDFAVAKLGGGNVSEIQENDSLPLAATMVDPGVEDSHDLVITWDDPNDAAVSTFQVPATNTLIAGQTFTSTTDAALLEITSVNALAGEFAFTVDHQYLDDGVAPGNGMPQDDSVVTVTAFDDDGGGGAADKTVTVGNDPPVFEAGPDETLPTGSGELSRLDIPFIDSGTLDVHTVTVDYDGDSIVDETINVPFGERTFDLAYLYAASGTYTVTVTVADDDLGEHSDSFTVEVRLNTPPVAVDDEVGTNEDTEFTFNVLANDFDAEGNIDPRRAENLSEPSAGVLTNNEDGTFTFDPNGEFEYLAAGDYAEESFVYQVLDAFDEHATATVYITITGVNDTPVANAGGVYVGEEGSAVMFDAAGSTDPDSDELQYRWDFNNDGAWDTSWLTTATAQHAWTDDYIGSITVEVSDGQETDVATTAVTIDNVAPQFGQPTGGDLLDTSFGDGGKTFVDLGFTSPTGDYAHEVVTQSDGKMLVIGGADLRVGMVRYNPDGTLDETFGEGGRVSQLFGAEVRRAAVDAQGRVVVVGSTYRDEITNWDIYLARYDPDGSVDTTFGNGGLVTTDIGLTDNFGDDIAIDSMGRIVVSGNRHLAQQQPETNFTILRYDAEGTLDTTFGNGGYVSLDVGNYDHASHVVIEPNDKIVIAGSYTVPYSGTGNALARFDEDGNLDASFGSGGVSSIAFSNYDSIANITRDHFGRYLVVGQTDVSGVGTQMLLARFLATGALDTSFGDSGRIFVGYGTSSNVGTRVVVDNTDRILATGYAYRLGAIQEEYNFAAFRCDANGSLDYGFGDRGKILTDFGSYDDRVYAVGTDANGAIVLAGTTFEPGGYGRPDFAIARYLDNGDLDTDFGVGGQLATDVGRPADYGVEDVLVRESDAGIFVLGNVEQPETHSDFLLAKYSDAGTLDAAFGNGGFVTTDFEFAGESTYDYPRAMAFDQQGRIVVAGSVSHNTGSMFGLARYFSDGQLDPSFGTAGKVTVSLDESSGYPSNYVNDVAIDPYNGIVVVGNSSAAEGDFVVVRFTNQGDLDTSFGTNGLATVDFAAGYDTSQGVAVDEIGRIVVVGDTQQPSSAFAIARLTGDGQLDTEFGTDGLIVTHFGDMGDWAASVVHDSAGNIVVGGNTMQLDGTSCMQSFALSRYSPNGILDESFGSEGKIIANVVTGGDYAFNLLDSIALGPDGGIVAIGWCFLNPPTDTQADFAVIRFNPNGDFDEQFGESGKVLVDIDNTWDAATALAVDGHGRIVVGGYASDNDRTSAVLVRLASVEDEPISVEPSEIDENETVTLSASFTDPGTDDIHTVHIDWGDNTGVESFTLPVGDRTFTRSHQFLDNPVGSLDEYVVTVTVEDDDLGADIASAMVTVNNVSPTANADATTISEDGPPATIDVLDNDTDPAGVLDPLTITGIDTTGTVGLVSFTAGHVSYDPNGQFESLAAGATNTDTFEYSIRDGDGGTATAVVTITITGVNDIPTVDVATFDIDENSPNGTSVGTVTASDPEDGNVTFSITAGNANGAFSIDGETGEIAVGNIAALDYEATPTFVLTVQAEDAGHLTGTALVTINLNDVDPVDGPSEVIAALKDFKAAGVLSNGEANPILNHLDQAIKDYNKGKTSHAIDKLVRARDEIQDQIDDGDLNSAQGQPLIDTINDVIVELLSGSTVPASGTQPLSGGHFYSAANDVPAAAIDSALGEMELEEEAAIALNSSGPAIGSNVPVVASTNNEEEVEVDSVFAELGEGDLGDDLFGESQESLLDSVSNGKKGGKKN